MADIDPEMIIALLNDPANADLLAGLGTSDDRARMLDKKSGLAEYMLGTPAAQGRQVGSAYVAASPLEHIGNAVMRGVGASQMHDINAQRAAIVQGNTDAVKRIGSIMSQAMRAKRAASPLSSQIGPDEMAAVGAGDLPYDPGSGIG